MEKYDLNDLLRLSGRVIVNEQLILEADDDEDEDKENYDGSDPVQDGDNDSKGYKYDADVYNIFGDEDQKFKYVPAQFGDNPLRDPLSEQKSLFDYLREIEGL